MGKYSEQYRKKLILRAKDVGFIAENKYFVEGMTDYELEQEYNRYVEYCLEHDSDDGFIPLRIPEERLTFL